MTCCDSCGLNSVPSKDTEFLTPVLPCPPGWGCVWNEGLRRLLGLERSLGLALRQYVCALMRRSSGHRRGHGETPWEDPPSLLLDRRSVRDAFLSSQLRTQCQSLWCSVTAATGSKEGDPCMVTRGLSEDVSKGAKPDPRNEGPAPVQVVQFSSVVQSCPTLFSPMNRSTPGLPVHHQLLELTQTHVR